MNNNSEKFKKLYISRASDLIRFASRFVDRYAAEDIVQDAFLKLWDDRFQHLTEDELVKLLYTSIRNLCIDHLRHLSTVEDYKDKKSAELSLKEIHYYSNFEKDIIKNDLYEHILSKIELLPEKRKKIFELAYLEGKKSAEIAEMLDISTRTVENSIYRALVFLRENVSKNIYLLIIYFLTENLF